MRVWEEWVARWAGWRAGVREGGVYRGWREQGLGGQLVVQFRRPLWCLENKWDCSSRNATSAQSHAPAFWEAPGSDLRQAIVSEANVPPPPPNHHHHHHQWESQD